ncbi:MAG: hypothetical protein RBR68_15870, partial [Tenuifilaceae bacterium]|nr:hypothetical protein [Tenuifilaceae bacterium]
YGKAKTALMGSIASAKARLAAFGSNSGSVDKGAGGSSGKDSTISDNTLEKLVEIFDQYYDINQEIKKLENSLARVVAVQDSLTGQALIDNLNQQLVIMQSQNEAIEKRLQLEKDERDQLKSELASKGITFDETGTITNYKAKFEELKAAVDVKAEAHKAAKTEAAKEALEKEYDAAKLAFDEFADLVERYDELNIDIIFNTEMELLEKQLEMIELNVQKMDIELEVTLDTNEAIRKWNEFEAVVLNGLDLEDPLTAITNTVKNLSSYWNGTDGSLDVLSKQIAGLNAEIAIMEAGGESSQYGSGETGISAATEVLKDRMDQYIELSLEYDEIVKSIKENTLNWIDATADGFSEINSQFEYVSSELEHHANVIKLIYGEEAYEQMEGYYEAQRANNSASIRALKSQVDNLTALRDALGQPGDENFDQELYDRYTSQIQNFQGELNSAIEESLQLLADEYSNSVSLILSNFAKDLSGGLGLPEIEKEWKRINEEADLYLDKTSATFKLNKLQSQYMDAINKADSSQVKQHLNDLLNEELKLLREKDELTQGDLERATKRFDIELKKIALEEAQRNKSTMKLQRDAQGNYSYVYTADEGAISKATEELEAAQEEFYESSRDSLKENKDQFLSLFSAYQDALAKPDADPEQVTKDFAERFKGVLGENSSLIQTLKDFYADTYGEGTAEYETAVAGLDDSLQTMMSNLIAAGGLEGASGDLLAQLIGAAEDYQSGVNGIGEDAGRDFDAINASMEEAVAYTQELVDKNEALINKMWEEADAINAATAAWREYDAATVGIRTSGNVAAGAASGTTASPTGEYTGVTDTGDATVNLGPGRTDTRRDEVPVLLDGDEGVEPGTDPGDTEASTGAGSVANNVLSAIKGVDHAGYTWGGATDPNKGLDCSGFVTYVMKKGGAYRGDRITSATIGSKLASGKGKNITVGWKPGHVGIGVNGEWWHSTGSSKIPNSSPGVTRTGSSWDKYYHPAGFDTGGYTGDWGVGDGKLAFLHQKEIVLNKQDTSNLLLAVSAVRDLVGKMKSSTTLSQQDALSRLTG